MSEYQYYYIPELNYYFSNYWKNNKEIEFQYVNLSEDETKDIFYNDNSFINMLFNNNFLSDSTNLYYDYMFKEVDLNIVDKSSYRRIKNTKKFISVYRTDTTGTFDIYNLEDSTSDNKILLDELFNYRTGNTVDLNSITYDDLDYNLAKLIYIYLDLMVNGNYTRLDTIDIISNEDSIIDNMFELYLLNESHKLLRLRKDLLISDMVYLKPIRKRYLVDDATNFYNIEISDELPNDIDKICVIKNGEFMNTETFNVIDDTTSVTLELDSTGITGFNLNDNDIIIIDYFTDIGEDV